MEPILYSLDIYSVHYFINKQPRGAKGGSAPLSAEDEVRELQRQLREKEEQLQRALERERERERQREGGDNEREREKDKAAPVSPSKGPPWCSASGQGPHLPTPPPPLHLQGGKHKGEHRWCLDWGLDHRPLTPL